MLENKKEENKKEIKVDSSTKNRYRHKIIKPKVSSILDQLEKESEKKIEKEEKREARKEAKKKEKKKYGILKYKIHAKNKELSVEEIKVIEDCVNRMPNTIKEYFRNFLTNAVLKGTYPIEAIHGLPMSATSVAKPRFEQLYDLAVNLAFPVYSKGVIRELVGREGDLNVRIWKVTLPMEYNAANVYIRAPTYQDAFALACDYAMRVSLRLNQEIPVELVIKVESIPEREVRRIVSYRKKLRDKMAKVFNKRNMEFTPRQVRGARMAALGHDMHSLQRRIATRIELNDLQSMSHSNHLYKISAVEAEVLVGALKGLKINPWGDEWEDITP